MYYDKKMILMGFMSFEIPRSTAPSSPVRFLKRIGAKVASVWRYRTNDRRRPSHRASSSANLARSRSYAETLDSQRAEAIEDCIEFLNSSSSLPRTSSVSNSCQVMYFSNREPHQCA
ncbi:hypothetical protein LIER_13066 [Lithospermum erythrorhizon]|uniref:Josephin-like protein n=1 Tax=Lithospermum erythrorhizon TaxID=34254 RepID=A0AAV3PW77_LITER